MTPDYSFFFTADAWRMHRKQSISKSKQNLINKEQRFRTSAWMKESYFPALWLFSQLSWAALDSYWLPAWQGNSRVGQSQEGDQQPELLPALLAAGCYADDAAQSGNFSVNCCKGRSQNITWTPSRCSSSARDAEKKNQLAVISKQKYATELDK